MHRVRAAVPVQAAVAAERVTVPAPAVPVQVPVAAERVTVPAPAVPVQVPGAAVQGILLLRTSFLE